MPSSRAKKRSILRSPRFLIVTAIVIVLLLGAGAAYGYISQNDDRIAAGVSAGSVALGGLTKDQARALLVERFGELTVTYKVPGATTSLQPSKGDGVSIATLDAVDTANRAFAVGRAGGPIISAIDRVTAAVTRKSVPVAYGFDGEALTLALDDRFKDKAKPAKDARLVVHVQADGKPTIGTEPEQDGWTFDHGDALRLTESAIARLASGTVTLNIAKRLPRVRLADLNSVTPAVDAALSRAPLSLTVQGQTWTVSPSLLADWLTALPNDKGGARLGLDYEKAGTFLRSRGQSLATEPTDAKFAMTDGRVTTFVPSTDGRSIDVPGSIAAIEAALSAVSTDKEPIALTMSVVPPAVSTESSNPYGIKEIIGVGATNFKGSPVNRVHNITIGAKAVDGIIIPAGEEFSLLKTLGTIDATTGYLQELVIKENKTTPEYGGGLCQIGSTTFRAVLDSGLPVTMRQNHSYRVSYYERDGDGHDIGPGKDATIYDPAPDFRFVNDTGHAILIRTAISGSKLSFTFWGVRDGRVAAQTASKVYNVVPPPDKKVIMTTDIAPGQEKCTEHAHLGSDASFIYTVTMADGTVKTKDFVSHYKPWQEVCLEGVTKEAFDAAKAAGTIAEDGTAVPATADAAGAAGN